MPRRDEVLRTLRDHEAELRARGVDALYLFGSVARDEAGPESDVDLFFDNVRPLGLEVIEIQDRIAEILGSEADVMTRPSLHPVLRSRIEAGAVRVF